MFRRPLDREAVLQALDAQIMGLLAVKRMVEGLSDEEIDAPDDDGMTAPCPDRPNGGPHELVWVRRLQDEHEDGMCRFCGAEWVRNPRDLPGVSAPGDAEGAP